MTFVLNLLHPRFSILAADVRGRMREGGTLKTGKVTIIAKGSVTVNAMDKIALSKDRRCAVGMAGTVKAHPYFDAVPKLEVGAAINAARAAANDWTSMEQFRVRLAGGSFMEQSTIATLYDEPSGCFCSFMAVAMPSEVCSDWHSPGRSSTLLHIGSGSSRFEKAVTLEAINAFIGALSADTDPASIWPWFVNAFTKVSAADDGCAPDFRAVIATKTNPEFRPWAARPAVAG
jgi:hypothetical protein